MQTRNPILDDLARVASGGLGVLAGLRDEIDGLIRQQLQRRMDGMELVNREEFEAVKAMASKAREEQERLTARIEALEAALAEAKPAKPRAKTK
ncbi:MAG: accessory factor UbiK family protein [Rhodospirillaceae bacterium]|jgi:BMFP domain-containing protein YqiC|nr:accessory factor UbiK family protein [Rhodospirillaceae bacterium]MBT6117001.1 accessory factor UbiK family protein [Rhodospirillaceae bacterium]